MNTPGSDPVPVLDASLLISIEEHATALARRAGSLLMELFQRDLQVQYKSEGKKDPVTNADKQAETLVMEGIRGKYPNHGILSEETPDTQANNSDFLWVIDPLDGTSNYINRYPFFSVSIGVLHRGVPVAGALFIPWPLAKGGHVIHASAGNGAFADDTPVHVFDQPEPTSTGLFMLPPSTWAQFSVGKGLRGKIGDMRVTGSIAYELALVASGALQYAAFSAPKIWDVAAGILIIQEAGGNALAYTSTHRWTPLRSFLEQATGLSANGDLRKWHAGVLVGNGPLVKLVADNLRPRRSLKRWLRRLRVTRWVRARAKGRSVPSPAEGKSGSQADRPHASGRHPPPNDSTRE